MDKYKCSLILKEKFGFDRFRYPQKQAINAVLSGNDCIVLARTGSGKSLCYQLPSLYYNMGCVIVISPLLALMQDQVNGAKSKGIIACQITSSLAADARTEIEEDLRSKSPTIQLLYLTPELITTPKFMSIIRLMHQNRTLNLIAVDEAHCISTWGHDFRSAYMKLGILRTELRGVPMIALTATATLDVLRDIKKHLNLNHATVLRQSVNRTNIHYAVRFKQIMEDEETDLVNVLNTFPSGTCGIIYTHKRMDCEYLSHMLKSKGFNDVGAYHAGMKDSARKSVQKAWSEGRTNVIVATQAFGMGIDKNNVRYVIHWTLPRSLEAYVQESGRAGRDGKESISVIYYSEVDKKLFNYIFRGKSQQLTQFKQVVKYCTNTILECRRNSIMRHFGEHLLNDAQCGNTCDVCRFPSKVLGDMQQLQAIAMASTITAKQMKSFLSKSNSSTSSRMKSKYVNDSAREVAGESERVQRLGFDLGITNNNGNSNSSSSSSYMIDQIKIPSNATLEERMKILMEVEAKQGKRYKTEDDGYPTSLKRRRYTGSKPKNIGDNIILKNEYVAPKLLLRDPDRIIEGGLKTSRRNKCLTSIHSCLMKNGRNALESVRLAIAEEYTIAIKSKDRTHYKNRIITLIEKIKDHTKHDHVSSILHQHLKTHAKMLKSMTRDLNIMRKTPFWGQMKDICLGYYLFSGSQDHNLTRDPSLVNFAKVNCFDLIASYRQYLRHAHAAYGDDVENALLKGKFGSTSNIEYTFTRFSSTSILLPAFYIALDHEYKSIVLSIRGTWQSSDILRNMKLHDSKFLSGKAHTGFAKASRHMFSSGNDNAKNEFNLMGEINKLKLKHPNYNIVFTGHSSGGSIAALLGMLVIDQFPAEKLKVYCYGAAPCIDQASAVKSLDYITSIIRGNDVVPRLNAHSLNQLNTDIQIELNQILKRKTCDQTPRQPQSIGRELHTLLMEKVNKLPPINTSNQYEIIKRFNLKPEFKRSIKFMTNSYISRNSSALRVPQVVASSGETLNSSSSSISSSSNSFAYNNSNKTKKKSRRLQVPLLVPPGSLLHLRDDSIGKIDSNDVCKDVYFSTDMVKHHTSEDYEDTLESILSNKKYFPNYE